MKEQTMKVRLTLSLGDNRTMDVTREFEALDLTWIPAVFAFLAMCVPQGAETSPTTTTTSELATSTPAPESVHFYPATEPATTAPPVPALQTTTDAARAFALRHGLGALQRVLTSFEVRRVDQLEEERRAAFLTALEQR